MPEVDPWKVVDFLRQSFGARPPTALLESISNPKPEDFGETSRVLVAIATLALSLVERVGQLEAELAEAHWRPCPFCEGGMKAGHQGNCVALRWRTVKP